MADIDSAGADLLVCGGDLVGYGARPNEVIEALRSRWIPTIMGNYDDGVGFDKTECGCAYKDPAMAALGRESLAWTQAQVTEENKSYLRGLLGRLEFTAHGRKVLAVHGSPRKINEYLYTDRPEDSLARIFASEGVDIILGGHTHLPYVRRIGEGLLVNAGSVGKPKDGDPGAAYSMLTIDEKGVEAAIRRVPYDVEAAARAVEESGLPREFAAMLREGRG